jgi:hypothetical protein
MSARIDFMAGRRVAVQMLHAAEALSNPDSASIEAQHREGEPQHNFVREYVERIIAKPELAEGFCAVLSDFLSVGADADHYARLLYADMVGQGAAEPGPQSANWPL